MFDRLKQLFNRIIFHIKCSFSSSCCVGQKEKEQNDDSSKHTGSSDLVKQIEIQNIYLSDKDIDK
jgi:hypothetical protein